MSAAKHLFEHVAGIPLPDWETFASGTKVILRAKNQVIFAEGESQPYLFVVRSGIVKLSYIRADGYERIKAFIGAGEIFGSLSVLVGGGKTDFHATALEQTCIERLEVAQLQEVMLRHAEWRDVVRQMMAMTMHSKDQRERELLILTTEERYALFLHRHRGFADRIQKSDIALYLGVTPEAFSRMRRRVGEVKAPLPVPETVPGQVS